MNKENIQFWGRYKRWSNATMECFSYVNKRKLLTGYEPKKACSYSHTARNFILVSGCQWVRLFVPTSDGRER